MEQSALKSNRSISNWANIQSFENSVLLQQLSDINISDVKDLIRLTGLSQYTQDVKVHENPLAITISFAHEYMAIAAASILQHRGEVLFTPLVETTNEVSEVIPRADSSSNSQECSEPCSSRGQSSVFSVLHSGSTSLSSLATQSDESTCNNSGSIRADGTTKPSGITLVPLPISPYSRARRILIPSDEELPLMTVSMRADLNFLDLSQRRRIPGLHIPNHSDPCRIVDAVMMGNTAVIAYNGETSQVAMVHNVKGSKPQLIKLPQKLHSLPDGKFTNAIRCIVPKEENTGTLQFFTGGSDKVINLWTMLKQSHITTHQKIVELSTIPHALGYRDGVLWVGSSRNIHVLNIEKTATPATIARSGSDIQNIILHRQAPTVRIIEVDHIDRQIQVYDDRKKLEIDRAPDISFGFRCEIGMPNRRHSRGDTNLSLYAKGFANGSVKIWDYRNSKKPLLTQSLQRKGHVVHTAFVDAGNLLCYSNDEVMFVDLNRAKDA